jgi:hypothetical protein
VGKVVVATQEPNAGITRKSGIITSSQAAAEAP